MYGYFYLYFAKMPKMAISKVKIIIHLLRFSREYCKTVLSHPFKTAYFLLRFIFLKKENPKKDCGRYLFNIAKIEELTAGFKAQSLLIIGLSYCQKPLYCEKRFSPSCGGTKKCQACPFKDLVKSEENLKIIFISTFSMLAKLILKSRFEKKDLRFLISACPFSIETFAFWAYALNLKGVALPLQGPTCPNFKAFALAEKGFKPKMTFLSPSDEILLSSFIFSGDKKKI